MSIVDLSSRTVLVTGATSGSGFETACRPAERGATGFVHGRTAEDVQAATGRLIATAGIGASQLCGLRVLPSVAVPRLGAEIRVVRVVGAHHGRRRNVE
ncbi:hypothetical protein [Streptomyces sp. S186]|uniref:hypothetical protein n=1 Tax=Streptomyces sp. S186 TaxID=3434395 RepID=UPI003F6800B0